MMLATGLRIGETGAITWAALDLDNATVEVRGTVIRIPGEGLIIKPRPKSRAGWRVIELPTWAVTMLRRRRDDYEFNEWDVVFTSPAGMLRDPSNTQADLRDVFDRIGFPDVTSQQLGHAKVSMTQNPLFRPTTGRHRRRRRP